MSTIEQLKSFGKVKNSYAGLSTHDDIAITVLFASRFFDDDNYFTTYSSVDLVILDKLIRKIRELMV